MVKKRTMEIDDMIKLYEEGNSTTEIAAKANVTARYVSSILKDKDVEKRAFGHWKRQYTLNEDYFKSWSNNMAYILGFFCADGFISSRFQQIGFAQKDKDILEQIKIELQSNQPLHLNKKTGVYMLNINSTIIKNDLIDNYGLTPNKSFDLILPDVPEEYISHYIRGYFDGDGNINYKKYCVSFVGGSQQFMQTFKERLELLGFLPYIKNKGKHYRLFITGRRSIKLFSEFIYKDKQLYLKRKYEMFQQESLPQEQLQDRKLKVTRFAVSERKRIFLETYKASKSFEEACTIIEVKKQTIKSWEKKDKEFAAQYFNLK
jgi:hypothetical protein